MEAQQSKVELIEAKVSEQACGPSSTQPTYAGAAKKQPTNDECVLGNTDAASERSRKKPNYQLIADHISKINHRKISSIEVAKTSSIISMLDLSQAKQHADELRTSDTGYKISLVKKRELCIAILTLLFQN